MKRAAHSGVARAGCRARPQSITELTRHSSLTRQAITKHLRVLERAGMVRCVRAGRESRFELDVRPLSEIEEYVQRVSREEGHGAGAVEGVC